MKDKLAAVKKFVSDHRVAIAVVATTAVCGVAHYGTVKGWNSFLAEKNLTDEFYTPEAE